MNIGISHLAFHDTDDFKQQLPVLKLSGIKHLELVFNKLDQELIEITYKNDILIKSTQSVLFGSQVNSMTEELFSTHMLGIFNKCADMGISTITLGSPKQRIRYDQSALLRTFAELDGALDAHNITLCIEPNSKIYGGDYFLTVDEIVQFIKTGSFKNIKTMIDTHNLALEGYNPSDVYRENRSYIKHVHVSEVGLARFKSSRDHEALSLTLRDSNYEGLIIYESLPHEDIDSSMADFKMMYG